MSNISGATVYNSHDNSITNSFIFAPVKNSGHIRHVGITGKYFFSKVKTLFKVGVQVVVKGYPLFFSLNSGWKFGCQFPIYNIPKLENSAAQVGVGYCPSGGAALSVQVEIND